MPNPELKEPVIPVTETNFNCAMCLLLSARDTALFLADKAGDDAYLAGVISKVYEILNEPVKVEP